MSKEPDKDEVLIEFKLSFLTYGMLVSGTQGTDSLLVDNTELFV